MDHRDKIRQNHELLGLENFQGISLQQLVRKVDGVFPSGVSKGRRLNVFIAWLNERLAIIDASSNAGFSKEVREWCELLIAGGYESQDIGEFFDDWSHEHSTVEPSSSRRLALARVELSRVLPTLCPAESQAGRSEAGQNKAEIERYGNIHPDRLNMSRSVIELDERPSSVIDISSDEDEEPLFLTGANILPKGQFDPKERLRAVIMDDHGQPYLGITTKSGRTTNMAKNPTKKNPRAGERAPGPGYLCKRCQKPGHYLQNCPTNGDSTYNLRPPKGYVCDSCGMSDHFKGDCQHSRWRAWASGTPQKVAMADREVPRERDGESWRRDKVERGIGDPRGRAHFTPPYQVDRRRSVSPSRASRRGLPQKRRDRRSRSPARRTSRQDRPPKGEYEDKERGNWKLKTQRTHERTLDLPVGGREEGRLAYEDGEDDRDDDRDVACLPLRQTPVSSHGPTQAFSRWLENHISAAAKDQALSKQTPVELGVTLKSLDCQPGYSPAVRHLIRQENNVWVRKIRRIVSSSFLADETVTKKPEVDARDISVGRLGETQVAGGMSTAKDTSGYPCRPLDAEHRATGRYPMLSTISEVAVNNQTATEASRHTQSIQSIAQDHDEDVVMGGVSLGEAPVGSVIAIGTSVEAPSPGSNNPRINDGGTVSVHTTWNEISRSVDASALTLSLRNPNSPASAPSGPVLSGKLGVRMVDLRRNPGSASEDGDEEALFQMVERSSPSPPSQLSEPYDNLGDEGARMRSCSTTANLEMHFCTLSAADGHSGI